MIYGKLVAGLLGLTLLGPFGLLLGLAVGHAFDRGLHTTLAFGSPEQLQKIQAAFFETCFSLLGHVAKADGRVSEEEIAHTEQIMAQLGVGAGQREQAINFFRAGAAADFQAGPLIAHFIETSRGHRKVHQTLLVFLISMAQADGTIDESERQTLEACAGLLGFNAVVFQQILGMVQGQQQYHQHQTEQSHGDLLADAYRALGVNTDIGDRELKKAYRRLMSENHPDKLIAQGVPEEMVKLATAKSQDIQSAYQTISEHRKRTA
jgi:DnaJ like chaperone protein